MSGPAAVGRDVGETLAAIATDPDLAGRITWQHRRDARPQTSRRCPRPAVMDHRRHAREQPRMRRAFERENIFGQRLIRTALPTGRQDAALTGSPPAISSGKTQSGLVERSRK